MIPTQVAEGIIVDDNRWKPDAADDYAGPVAFTELLLIHYSDLESVEVCKAILQLLKEKGNAALEDFRVKDSAQTNYYIFKPDRFFLNIEEKFRKAAKAALLGA